jgi:hypothetical protein
MSERVLKTSDVRKFVTVLSVIVVMLTLSTIGTSIFTSSMGVSAQETETTSNNGERIVQQGMATSSPDPLPGHESHQSITILRLRDDNAVYSGRVTFTTTQPVEVQILHRDMTANSTAGLPVIPDKFGSLAMIQLPGDNGRVTITNVVPKFTEGATGTSFAASVPFSGNAVALHNLEGEPFFATYTATAEVLGEATRVDDIER